MTKQIVHKNSYRQLETERTDPILKNHTMKTNLTIIALAAIFAAGCMTQHQRAALDSWMGQTQQELELRWGAPTRMMPDGQGGQILIYDSNPGAITSTSPGYFNGRYYYPGVTTTTVHAHSTQFFVNSSGVVYSWRRQ